MTLPRRTKLGLLLPLVALGAMGLYFPFRAYVLAPYQTRQEQLRLPALPEGLSLADLGVPGNPATFPCSDISPGIDDASLQREYESLHSRLQQSPSDLCVGNQFREVVRYRQLKSGDFAINLNSLPSQIAAIAKDPNSIPTSPANSSKISADELEPAKSFRDLAAIAATNTPEAQLQLGLSYVDLMIRQGGREHKARLSSRSIEALSSALDRRPYMLAARYARGLNYLYWPVIAGKLPLAVQDFKTCIALSHLSQLQDHPPLVIAEAYVALGDTYVKLADSALNRSQQADLIRAGRAWWEEGLRRFPHHHDLEQRLGTEPDRLIAYVDSQRGLETYINTDLDLLWTM